MLDIQGISKSYGSKSILNDIHFQVEPGQIVVVLGPSGTGKSTLLSIAAGLTKPDSGRILLHNADITSQAAHKREITLLTQKANLFPFMSVADNVAFSPKMKSLKKSVLTEMVNRRLKEISLTDYNKRDPESLSGGEQQRVALARALSSEPKVLLMDEPFSSLDHNIRLEHQDIVKKLVNSSSLPVIFVTHQLEEAMALADQIIIIDQGTAWCNQTPQELYHNPKNVVSARTVGFNVVDCSQLTWLTDPKVGTKNVVCVRPENISITETDPQLQATCIGYSFIGGGYRIQLKLEDGQKIDFLTDLKLEEVDKLVSASTIGIRSNHWIAVEK